MKKIDRRIKYTKKILKESLINLLNNKPLNKITIKEICQKADVNRSTFYNHYQDQYSLLKQIENEFLNEIENYLKNYHLQNNQKQLTTTLECIFFYIKENQALSKILLNNPQLKKRIMLLVKNQMLDEWQQYSNEKTAPFVLLFSVNGSIGILEEWLKNDLKQTPREIAEIIANFIYSLKKHG